MTRTGPLAERSLSTLAKGDTARIARLADASSQEESAIILRLMELGFVPGETIRLIARAFPGGHPIAVRLGNSSFALRLHEASLIFVAVPGAI